MNIEISLVPQSGYVYALGDEPFFSQYSVAQGHILLPDGTEFRPDGCLEIHFFNEETEYRILQNGEKYMPGECFAPTSPGETSESKGDTSSEEGPECMDAGKVHKRSEKSVQWECSFVLTKADDEGNPDYVTMREEQWLRPEFCPEGEEWKLVVMNRFEYTDDDRLCLTGYRLAGVIRPL